MLILVKNCYGMSSLYKLWGGDELTEKVKFHDYGVCHAFDNILEGS